MSKAQRDFRGLKEAKKYDIISKEEPASWFNPNHGLQKLERLRFPYFNKVMGGFRGKRILDVGCGVGILSEDLVKAGTDWVLGIDISRKSIKIASRRVKDLKLKNIKYLVRRAEKFKTGKFDIVFCVDVLEHVDDLDKTLDVCARALKKGGYFGFLTHNQTPEAFMELIWKWEYKEKTSSKGSHDFHKFISPQELKEKLARRNIIVKDIMGIDWNSKGDDLQITKNLKVSYLGYGIKKF